MIFSHLLFIYAFLPLLMILYYCRKNNSWRRGVLLAFSLVFYAWGEPLYILLMLFSAAMNYMFGIFIGARKRHGIVGKVGFVVRIILKKDFVPCRTAHDIPDTLYLQHTTETVWRRRCFKDGRTSDLFYPQIEGVF